MKTSARVVLDSISQAGTRLTTLEVTFHRFVLAEMNTHRVFSRSSASSRAIPVEKMLQRVIDNPAWPIEWTSEQRGMNGGAELEGQDLVDAKLLFERIWQFTTEEIAYYIKNHPEKSHRLHKSLINRRLEPDAYHTAIISSTDWENFFKLRCHRDAQPEMREAAEEIYRAMFTSCPQTLQNGKWHTPYIQEDELKLPLGTKLKVSAGRCARVSYLNHDGVRAIEDDVSLFDKLIEADPKHSAPLEHVATPATSKNEKILGNFRGWHQLRHRVESGYKP